MELFLTALFTFGFFYILFGKEEKEFRIKNRK